MSVSDTLKTAVNNPELDDEFVLLVTLAHVALVDDIRITSYEEDVTSRGLLYQACPFELSLPLDDPDQPLRCQAKIDNVDESINKALESAIAVSRERVTVKFEVVLESDFETPEITHDDFNLEEVKVNIVEITGNLTLEDYTVEPYPAYVYTPGAFPGGY